METKQNPWEYEAVHFAGSYVLIKADEETRERKLKEYKHKRKAELTKELHDLERLH